MFDDDEMRNENENSDDGNPANILEVPRFSSCLGNGKRGGGEIQVDNLQFEILVPIEIKMDIGQSTI